MENVNNNWLWVFCLLLSMVSFIALSAGIIAMLVYETTHNIFATCVSLVLILVSGASLIALLIKTLTQLLSEPKEDNNRTK
jgi:hypothetical protein